MMSSCDPPDSELEEWFRALFAWDDQQAATGPEVRHWAITYGSSVDQVVDVWQPAARRDDLLVMSLHGGFFAEDYTREINQPLSRALARAGLTVWNVEYRRAAPGSGGFEATTSDVTEAVALAREHHPGRIVVLGHSAGGYLAAWSAALEEVDAVVMLAAVTDLDESARSRNDDGAITRWLGAPIGDRSRVHVLASLGRRLPTSTAHCLLHGAEDLTVPAGQSIDYAQALEAAGDPVSLHVVEGCGHFALIDPRTAAFDRVVEALISVSTDGSDDRR